MSGERLWILYLFVAAPAALLLCFIMPPLQVNDEIQHFFRAYQVSTLVGLGRAQGGVAGGDIPVSLTLLVKGLVGSLAIYKVPPLEPQRLATTLSWLRLKLAPDQTVFADFSATVLYSPISYLPQASGMALARLAGGGPLACFYAARLANLAAALAMTAAALRLAPFGRYALLLVALLPTVLYLDASISQDAGMISALLLFVALCLRAYRDGAWSVRGAFLAALAGIILTMSKAAYGPVMLLAFAPCFTGRRSGYGVPALIVLSGLLSCGAWLVASHGLMVWHGEENDSARQIAFVLHHKLYTAWFTTRWLLWGGPFLLKAAIGMFGGWPPEISLPGWEIALLFLGFLALPFSCDLPRLAQGLRLLLALLMPVTVYALIGLLYVVYEPVGWPRVDMLQGRHLVPVLVLLTLNLAAVPVSEQAAAHRVRLVLAANAALGAACTVITMWLVYRPF
jgi:uncharacterized membrane protein